MEDRGSRGQGISRCIMGGAVVVKAECAASRELISISWVATEWCTMTVVGLPTFYTVGQHHSYCWLNFHCCLSCKNKVTCLLRCVHKEGELMEVGMMPKVMRQGMKKKKALVRSGCGLTLFPASVSFLTPILADCFKYRWLDIENLNMQGQPDFWTLTVMFGLNHT